MAVSEQIIQVLDALCARFGLVIDWTAENVIPYISTLCEKLVSWEIWSSVAWMAIMVVASIVWTILMIIFREAIQDDLSDGGPVGVLPLVGCFVLGAATIIVIGTQIFDIIKCVTFPELFVFEYIKNLISTTR